MSRHDPLDGNETVRVSVKSVSNSERGNNVTTGYNYQSLPLMSMSQVKKMGSENTLNFSGSFVIKSKKI